MKKTRLLFAVLACTLICLSACDKTGGVGSSLEGTFVLERVEGTYDDVVIGGESGIPPQSFSIDYKNKRIKMSGEDSQGHYDEYTPSWDIHDPNVFRLLEYYNFFPTKYVFYDDGTVLCSAETYDTELIDFLDDNEITLSAHYHINKGIIDFSFFIGDPVSFKLISKSGGKLVLEPTQETLDEYNESLEYDTKLKFNGLTTYDQMTWTQATYYKY